MQSDPAHELEPLLAHTSFVQRLAGRLAADGHDAEDLTQETWLALLRGRSRPRGSPRAFLAGVLRRRALQRSRSEDRRREREARALEPGLAPSAAEALERAELGRELAALVIELEEPFRSAVLLRHVSDLSPRAIAERLGVPLKTVESRLARGHTRLRERWRRRHAEGGDQSGAWIASLALLAERSPSAALVPTTPPILGALIVNTKLVLITLAAAGAGGLFWLAAGRHATSDPVHPPSLVEAVPTTAATLEDPGVEALEPSRTAERQTASEPIAQQPPTIEAAAEALLTVRGRAVDAELLPLAGVQVVQAAFGSSGASARTLSDAQGRFELTTPQSWDYVSIAEPTLENLFRVRLRPDQERELLLVAAPHRALAGAVRNDAGEPVAGASVALELPETFRTRFDVALDAVDLTSWSSTTDAHGRFELARAPVVAGAAVVASLEGYAPAAVEAPSFAQLDLELVLRRPAIGETTLAGRVVEPAGAPVAGALVSLGVRCATTAADGSFRLDRSDAMEAVELRAVAAGRLPASYRAFPDPVTGLPSWPEWIELEVGGEPLELAGRVVDQHGAPRADLRVWLDDPTPFGVLAGDNGAQLELLAAPLPSTYDDDSDHYFRTTGTDADGHFRIQGLGARSYRLGLLDSGTLETARLGPFEAGRSNLVVEMPRGEARTLELRLVSRAGQPTAGAQVLVHAPTFGGVHLGGGGRVATSDAEGRVRFDGLAGRRISLWISGESVVPDVRIVEDPGPGEIEVPVEVLCHLKVDLGDQIELADGCRALDAAGEELPLYEIGANGNLARSLTPLIEGRSVPLGVSDAAATLVLLKGEQPVREIPLRLTPGELQIVTP